MINPDSATKVKYGMMGLILGAAIAILIALKAGFMVPRSGAEQLTNASILKTRVAICIAQFMHAPRSQDKLRELKALSFMDRDDYIRKGGWDRMPGEDKPGDQVNRVCGDKLSELS